MGDAREIAEQIISVKETPDSGNCLIWLSRDKLITAIEAALLAERAKADSLRAEIEELRQTVLRLTQEPY